MSVNMSHTGYDAEQQGEKWLLTRLITLATTLQEFGKRVIE